MHHRITYMYINFQPNRVSKTVKPCAQIYLQKITSYINFATILIIFFNQLLQTCITIKRKYQFSANRVCRSVKTVHTNLFARNCKLHKFATTNSNFETIDYFGHASS